MLAAMRMDVFIAAILPRLAAARVNATPPPCKSSVKSALAGATLREIEGAPEVWTGFTGFSGTEVPASPNPEILLILSEIKSR
jgi:hypothetical protein